MSNMFNMKTGEIVSEKQYKDRVSSMKESERFHYLSIKPGWVPYYTLDGEYFGFGSGWFESGESSYTKIINNKLVNVNSYWKLR